MSNALDRDPLFIALTRPQMLAGVTYTFFVINGVVSTEIFLLSKSAWTLVFALIIHVAGVIACLKEPRIFDLQLAKAVRCQRVRNYRFWRCNSYRA